MYILVEEPKSSGTHLAGAFDAIDQVHGTEEFSEEQAVGAMVHVMDLTPVQARSLFNILKNDNHISEV